MFSIEQRKSLSATIGAKHGVDPVLLCCLAHQESSWCPWAIRYEPAFFARYILPMADKLSDTEARARAFSWGLAQIMGQTARELGFLAEFASLCDPEIGLEWGAVKLKQCLDAHKGDEKAALEMYNGGGNPDYADEVLAHWAIYI
jgi:soluble lytic murein transglycosylase-like protein